MKKEYSGKQKQAITPSKNAPIVGTKYPKDFYYRKQHLPFTRYTLCMPDGMICSIQVFEGEDADSKIHAFIDNWYEVTKRDPETFNHFVIKEKCPICGSELRAKVLQKGCAMWCINHPECDYQKTEDGLNARQLICERHGLKFEYVHKSGASVIFKKTK